MITTTRSALTGADLATRVRALDFNALGLILPNPDPLLKELGQDVAVYRNIARDPHVGACIRRRKAAVKALDCGLDRGLSRSRIARAVEDTLSKLDVRRIVGQILEAPLYGYQPLEISWRGVGGLTIPADVQSKPPEWFSFDAENQLRLKTWAAPMEGELLPDRKFILPRQDATYQNPYGLSDLSLCYWPVIFGKGGKRFWLTFAEKYGSAFAVGKLPRTATDAERQMLLDGLEALISDGVATVPDDGSVELVEMAGKSASADLYESLVMHCRGEISIVMTGTNQTMEASSNKASAHAGMDVARDLRDSDAEIAAGAVNQLIHWIVEVNWPGAEAPVWSMWDQKEQDELQAKRDESNAKSGAKFTNQYWMRGYGYQEGDLQEPAAPPPMLPGATVPAPADVASAAFAESAVVSAAPIDADVTALASAAAASWQTMLAQIQSMVASADDLTTLQRTLTNAYGGLDSAQLVRVMAAALALAELRGMADVHDESGAR